MKLPLATQVVARSLSNNINKVTTVIGQTSAWFVVGLIALTLFDVMMRYIFHAGSVALQELEWHLFGLIILMGASFTLQQGNHVRVDLIYSSAWMSERSRRWVDIAGTVFFLLPFCALIIWTSVPFAYDAYMHQEISPDPGGLGHRWILKATIPLGFALLALQGIAETLANLYALSDDD